MRWAYLSKVAEETSFPSSDDTMTTRKADQIQSHYMFVEEPECSGELVCLPCDKPDMGENCEEGGQQ